MRCCIISDSDSLVPMADGSTGFWREKRVSGRTVRSGVVTVPCTSLCAEFVSSFTTVSPEP